MMNEIALAVALLSADAEVISAPAEGSDSLAEQVEKLRAEVRSAKQRKQYNAAAKAYLDLHALALSSQGPGDNALSSLDGSVRMLAKADPADKETFCSVGSALRGYSRLNTSPDGQAAISTLEREFQRISKSSDLTCDEPPPLNETMTSKEVEMIEMEKGNAPPASTLLDERDGTDRTITRPENADTPPKGIFQDPPPPLDKRGSGARMGSYIAFGLGGGLGVGLLVSGLAWGATSEREGRDKAYSGVDAGELQASVIADGRTANALAITGATIAVVAVITGAALVGVAHRARASKQEQKLSLGPGQLRLSF